MLFRSAGCYYSNEDIDNYNRESFSEEYPNQKKYYTNPMDVCLDYFSIKNTSEQLWEILEDYESGAIEELPDDYDTVAEMYAACDDYEKLIILAAANMDVLQDVFKELQLQKAPVETEAKHLFKNIPFIMHHR